MRKHLCLLIFIFVLALAPGSAQTSPSSSTNEPSGQVKPSNPGAQEQTPSATAQPGSSSATAAASPGEAQGQIQKALNNDPDLRSNNIMVSVTGNDLVLTGDVASQKEKDAAKKIAERYAGSLRVKDHLKIRSGGTANPQDDTFGNNEAGARNEVNAATGGMAGAMQTQSTSSGSSMSRGIGSNTSVYNGTIGARNSPAENQTISGENAVSESDLQGQIQNALRNEPTLSNNNVHVTVSEDLIDVSGAVANGKEKLTAKRIVQSYAGNRKVKDHLTVKGHSPENAGSSSEGQNPAGNPDQNKSNSPKPPF